ncbi:glycerophosphoryl diester phosphodiesterase [Sulfolobales archaeon HS-7]|nr:glycerophosphoryl diester phosphodiesterase [Sulfolobales archaeon HS-7]
MKPTIIAHRGASAESPENTLTSFQLAREIGADGVELDVHLSKDGEIFVIHDDTLNRTTNFRGRVKDFTATEIKRAVITYGKITEKVPTLREVFESIGDYRYVIEIKHSHKIYPGIEEKLLSLIDEFGYKDIEITSFDYDALAKVREVSNVETGMIFIGKARWMIGIAKEIRANRFHISKSLATEEDKTVCNTEGIKLGVWTVDSEEELNRFSYADSVTTNDPRKIISALRGRKS